MKKIDINFIYNFIVFLLGFFIVSLPIIIHPFVSADPAMDTILKKIAFIGFGLSFFVLILAFVRPKYFLFILIPIYFLVPIEIYLIIELKTLTNEGIINSILNTNLNESIELLLSNIFSVIIFSVIFILYTILIFHMKNSFVFNKRIKITLLILSCVTQVLVVSREFYRVEMSTPTISFIDKLDDVTYLYRIKMSKTFPANWLVNIFLYADTIKMSRNYKNKIANFHFGAKEILNIDKKKIIVMIIGESARRSNFSLYGYKRKTNPFLETEDNFIVMRNVEAIYNLTVNSYPIFLSRSHDISSKIHLSEASLLQAYKESGFHTIYINNQKFRYGSIYDIYSKQADNFIEAGENVQKYQDLILTDESVADKFDEIIKNNHYDKIFVVIHSIGSHVQYKCRYPKEFDFFKPTTSFVSRKNKEQLVNAYDNSIIFTDYFIHRIISTLKTKMEYMSLMMYASDHGENIYDDKESFFGHGGTVMTEYEKEIPMFIWYSSKYFYSSKEKINTVVKNIDAYVATNHFFHSMLDLSDIYIDEQTYQKSIASKKFENTIKNKAVK